MRAGELDQFSIIDGQIHKLVRINEKDEKQCRKHPFRMEEPDQPGWFWVPIPNSKAENSKSKWVLMPLAVWDIHKNLTDQQRKDAVFCWYQSQLSFRP